MTLSALLRCYVEDNGFTGSSMGRAIEAAWELETKVLKRIGFEDPALSRFNRLSALLCYMSSGWAWNTDDMLTAARWAEQLENSP